jgi:hypothetical protein
MSSQTHGNRTKLKHLTGGYGSPNAEVVALSTPHVWEIYPEKIEVSQCGSIVTAMADCEPGSHQAMTALGSHVLGKVSKGAPVALDLVHSFSIRIENCGRLKPTIGVTGAEFHLTPNYKHHHSPNGWGFGGEEGNSFVFQSSAFSAAACVGKSINSATFPPLKTGDIVQVIYDATRRSVAFKINGHRLTKELSGLPGKVRAFVSMRNSGDSFELLEGTLIAPISAATGFIQVDESGIHPLSLERTVLQEHEASAISEPFFAASFQSSENNPFSGSLLSDTTGKRPPRAGFYGSRVRTRRGDGDDESTMSTTTPAKRQGWIWNEGDTSATRKFVGSAQMQMPSSQSRRVQHDPDYALGVRRNSMMAQKEMVSSSR